MTIRRIAQDDSGSSMLQFAFVAPVLILLTLGIIDMGRLGLTASAMRNGAIDAARFASMRGAASPAPATESDIAAVARDNAAGVPASDLTVAVIWSPDNSSGSEVKVRLSYTLPLFIASLIPLPDVHLTRSSAMVIF